jgi:hypothetical protein
MPIYEATANSLIAVPTTSFAALGMRERADLRRLLAARIEALEDGLLVIAEEFGDWADSARRIDLLCLDTNANLVVVELKRDDTGGHMELQALRYAAMVSAMTFDQAAATLASHRSKDAPDHEAARAAILAHLGWTEPDEEAFAQETRIILAAADFGRELTTTVLWLREREIDIRCLRLRPYRLANGPLLLDIQQIIPLPETSEFITRIQEKKAAERKERGERAQLLERFLAQLAERALARTPIHEGRTPDVNLGVLSGAIGKAGLSINYVIAKHSSRVELLLQSDDAGKLLLKLKEGQAAIESVFGGPLVWLEKEGVRQCRVFHQLDGGYRSPETEWPAIQDRLIDAMIRLDCAMRPRVAQLP